MTTKNAKSSSTPTIAEMMSGNSPKVEAAAKAHAAAKAADKKAASGKVSTKDFGRLTDKQIVAKSKASKPAAKKPAAKSAVKSKKVTIASCIRDAIMAGKNNREAFEAARKVLGASVVTDDKLWFSGWYRADMKRKGVKNVPPSRPTPPAAKKASK